MTQTPEPIVSGRYFLPKPPLLWRKWMPACAVTSVKVMGPEGRRGAVDPAGPVAAVGAGQAGGRAAGLAVAGVPEGGAPGFALHPAATSRPNGASAATICATIPRESLQERMAVILIEPSPGAATRRAGSSVCAAHPATFRSAARAGRRGRARRAARRRSGRAAAASRPPRHILLRRTGLST